MHGMTMSFPELRRSIERGAERVDDLRRADGRPTGSFRFPDAARAAAHRYGLDAAVDLVLSWSRLDATADRDAATAWVRYQLKQPSAFTYA